MCSILSKPNTALSKYSKSAANSMNYEANKINTKDIRKKGGVIAWKDDAAMDGSLWFKNLHLCLFADPSATRFSCVIYH